MHRQSNGIRYLEEVIPLLRQPGRKAAELAEIAAAASMLGLPEVAQTFIDAAYDQANGFPIEDLGGLVAEIRATALATGRAGNLSTRQKELLGVNDDVR